MENLLITSGIFTLQVMLSQIFKLIHVTEHLEIMS